MRHFRFTLAASLLGACLVYLAIVADVDVLSPGFLFLEHVESGDKDHVIAALLLVAAGLFIDFVLTSQRHERARERELQIAAARTRVFKATMRTVQDLVNNFLNGIQLVRLEGEETLSPETIEVFDRLSNDVATKLKALGDLETVTEREMASGTGIEYRGGQ